MLLSPARILAALALLVSVQLSRGADDYPEVAAFAAKMKGVRWDLRGTFGLKHLRFDGSDVREVKSDGREGGAFESAFVDVGVLRLNFRGPNTGWYFFGDDMHFVTPLTVAGEVPFALQSGAQAKTVRDFPKDLVGVTFESVADERKLPAGKLRWNGATLEVWKQLADKSWGVEKLKPLVAGRRVFEVDAPGGPFWIAFSQDGKEAWMLQIENIFGGEAASTAKQNPTTPAPSGLTPQQAEILLHIERLRTAGEKVRADALTRHLKRQLGKKPDLLAKVEQRLGK